MSFQLLHEKVIDSNLCISCSLCAKNCKHITMETSEKMPKGKPKLTGKCIMTKNGLKCGLCYQNCPIVKKYLKNDDKSFFTTQQRIEELFKDRKQHTIQDIAQNLAISGMNARYEVLRLVKRGELFMKVDPNLTEALFWR